MEKGLNNNQLKIIALIIMTIDHVGMLLLPQVTWLRLVGRLAFPIFAYMIAEGCRHTKGMPRYLCTLAGVAALCQLVYFFALGSLYQCIMVTFTLSVGLVFLIRKGQETKNVLWWIAAAFGVAAAYFLAEILPGLLPGTDYGIDYGFWGILLPVAVYLCPKKWMKLLIMLPILALIAISGWEGQWMALTAVVLLAFYNGKRGKWKLKWLFYFYYPAHLAVLEGIAWLLSFAR